MSKSPMFNTSYYLMYHFFSAKRMKHFECDISKSLSNSKILDGQLITSVLTFLFLCQETSSPNEEGLVMLHSMIYIEPLKQIQIARYYKYTEVCWETMHIVFKCLNTCPYFYILTIIIILV